MDEIVRDFLMECSENLGQLDLDLVALEKNPNEEETLARIFRTLHNVKGTAGFLGFEKLAEVGHSGENLLSALREGRLTLSPEITDALLAVVDVIRRIIDAIEATGAEGDTDCTPLSTRCSTLLRELPKTSAMRHAAESAEKLPQAPEDVEAKSATLSDRSIRVDVGMLDKLMNLVGELVLARNQIVQYATTVESATILGPAQHLDQITSELQAGIMKTRMQPIGNIWVKFPRLVRDQAAAFGKIVRIEMTGEATELDKTIIEAIRDPLTHLIRNAIDHGIETPDVRAKSGKLSVGMLRLRAYHEGGKINIELMDDGAGIDTHSIRNLAIQAKLITPNQAALLKERDLINLIFLPGFSTAKSVTNLSGRGVGMDVVKLNIEKLDGSVEIQSELGQGTSIRLKIPLTLAIIPALTVFSGGSYYAIPQINMLELLRLDGGLLHHGIEDLKGTPVYRLRDRLLPLVYLNRLLELRDGSAQTIATSDVNIVVLQSEDRQFGLVVDDIRDTEEIVVKPLHKELMSSHVYAGATIMGDGKVALILDVHGLAQKAHVFADQADRTPIEEPAPAPVTNADVRTILLFATEDGGRMAIPLSQLARLEEVPASSIEHTGHQEVMQYRGEIVPVIRISRLLHERRKKARPPNAPRRETAPRPGGTGMPADREMLQVVVYTSQGRSVALVVGLILDIVEVSLEARSGASRAGVEFTAVIQGRITEFLDIAAILKVATPAILKTTSSGKQS